MLFVVMYLLWFLFNGRVTMELAIIGFFVCGVLSYFTKNFIREEKKESILKGHVYDFIKYGFVLFLEIIKSNIAVIKLILNPNMDEWHPIFITFTSHLEDERFRVLLANSITLTPGTITVGMEEKEFTVHVLDNREENKIENGVFAQELKKIEGRKKGEN